MPVVELKRIFSNMKQLPTKADDKTGEKWLDQGAKRAVISDAKFTWWPVIGGLPQGLMLAPGLCHVFINNLDNRMDYPSRFSGDTTLWEVCTMEKRAAVLKYLNKMKKWADRNLVEYDRGKCKVL